MITNPIRTFKTGEYTHTRTPGSYVAGLWVDGTPVVTNNVTMSIQPVGKMLKFFPDGCTTEDVRYLLCDEVDLQNRDQVTFKGEQWEIFKVNDWNARGVTWCEAWMARINRGVVTS